MDLGEELLARPVSYGSRLLALSYLEEAKHARKRMNDAQDDEALHDFRVALRRLRSCFRAYRPQLESSVSRKQRQRLRRVVDATGVGRDLQVQMKWLEAQREGMEEQERAGLDWLLARMQESKEQADLDLEQILHDNWAKLHQVLESDLSAFTVEVRLGDSPEEEGATALARLLRELWRELRDHLDQVSAITHMEEAHAARINAKRLRYLLSPIRHQLGDAKIVLDRLEALQDQLGELHDADVLESDLFEAIRVAPQEIDLPATGGSSTAPQRAPLALGYDVRQGLLDLARRARGRREAAFSHFREEWSSLATAVFYRQLDQLAERLATGAAELPADE